MEKASSVGGGCINQAYKIEGNGQRFFVKLNDRRSLAMFEAEAAGLQEIHDSGTLQVPEPVCWGEDSSGKWLVMEYLDMTGSSFTCAAALGTGLAAMHQRTSDKFGWKRDNTIGSTAQINTCTYDWVQFWREYRLGYQLKLARVNGHTGKLQVSGDKLLASLESFFPEEALPLAAAW